MPGPVPRPTRIGAAIAFGVLALCAAPGRAEEPCAADARRACAGIPPGDGRVFYCLKTNEGSLSEECRAVLRWAEERAREVALGCQADTFAWCQGVPPGHGRLLACLLSHRDSLSSQCQDDLARASAFAAGCGADIQRLCPGLPQAQGAAALVCLARKRSELSPQCQAIFGP